MLHAVYELRSRWPGALEKLRDIYRILALLPQSGRRYSLEAFAHDVYLLDRHHQEAAAQSGLTFRLQPGATAARRRSHLLVVFDSQGRERTYYGIEFPRRRSPESEVSLQIPSLGL